MPDLFLGAAAGPPGLPDWIDHAFPVPVKNGPAYLAKQSSVGNNTQDHPLCN